MITTRPAAATKKKTVTAKASKDTAASGKASAAATKGKTDDAGSSKKTSARGRPKDVQDQQPATKAKTAKSKPQSGEDTANKSRSPAKSQDSTAAKPTTKTKAEPKVKPAPKMKAERKVKNESTPKRAPVKKEPKIKPEPGLDNGTNALDRNIDQDGDVNMDRPVDEPTTRNITGVYNITCPQLAAQYPEEASNFRLFLYVDNDAQPATKIWGGSQLVHMSGVLLMQDHCTGPATSVTFGWRARNTETRRLSFGRGCYGAIVFSGYSSVQGAFYNLFPETVEFQGDRRPGPLWCGRPAWKFEEEWEGFVKEAYGR